MNQDHFSQQPAADAYVIGGPSDFAEDLSPATKGWKADLGSDGNTKRDEIGMPEYRGDTFNNPEKSPGVSPSRQASLAEIHAKAEVATRVARLMLKSGSEQVIEDQALALMELPISNLKNTLTRLAQEQDDEDDDEDEGQSKEAADDDEDDADGDDEETQSKQARARRAQQEEDDDDDEGQSKQARRRLWAQDDDDDDEDEGQSKQAKDLPPEFLENIKKKKDESKDKGEKKEARRRWAQQQDDDDDEGQSKQARRRRAQQESDDDAEDEGQSKQARRSRFAEDEETQGKDEEGEKQVGKEAYALIKQAAAQLLGIPGPSRLAAYKVALPGLVKAATEQLGPLAQDQEQVQAQVQQLVQNAMQDLQGQQQQQVAQGLDQQLAQGQQQQVAQGQGQQTLADDLLVDQMLQDPGDISEPSIQMDAPEFDIGLGQEDPALQQIFASDAEVQRALEAQALQSGHTTTARTASTRTVGTRPSAGVSQLGGGTAGPRSSGADEVNKLAGMWASAPDVSSVFRS